VQFTRSNKVSRLIQKELSEIFLNESRNHFKGLLITVTHVFISKDFSVSKIYLSLFPTKKKEAFLNTINKKRKKIKMALAQKTRRQLKKTPELFFYIDNSMDHYEEVDSLLK
jgi:ribosome-binding factor A